jgi:putative FmdB family regulatory protein
MPIYEYVCESCGKVSEFLVGVGQGEATIGCKHCGSSHVKQQLSAGNFSMSGSRSRPQGGKTCCGKEERCDNPPCSTGGGCKR